jgi:dipeptidyl aminopeptidase/acylaminoacyl peptidase
MRTGQKSLLLDPNPQFRDLKFGRVEAITFSTANGHSEKGVLYLPPDYNPGKKYPLVIQTHAWTLDRFSIDGPYTTAFAAQPLAGRGFMVAQLVEDGSRIQAPKEVPDEASAYEGVIDYLDHRGLIDRDCVGIIGFSRTGLSVEYALTHSKYYFAAASLSDISDGGYFRYVALLNNDTAATDSEILNGGLPFGQGLGSWLKNSPGFHLDKVVTPVLMAANSPMSLLFEWEWFAGLSRLGKAVELIYIPEGGHVLTKPRDRMVSQEGNVDWFCFWLQSREDPDPSKTEQYARWRELRTRQERNAPDHQRPNTTSVP